jgi:hypothetical protein
MMPLLGQLNEHALMPLLGQLNEHALMPLLGQLNEHAKLSMLRNSTWTFSNFCRGKPQPAFEQVCVRSFSFIQLLFFVGNSSSLTCFYFVSCRASKSKEYVRENFSWQHYYWYLTSDGIEFLRILNLPSKIVPNTLKKYAAFCSQVLKSQLCTKCVSFEFALS